jgi:hypothetical protein
MNATAAAISNIATEGRPCDCKNQQGYAKQWYRTELEAEVAAKRANDEYPSPNPQRPYRCEDGGMWHLTSKPLSEVLPRDGEFAAGRVRNTKLDQAMKVAEAAQEEKRTRIVYSDDIKMEAFKLRDKGLTCADIARRLNMLDGDGSPKGQLVRTWLESLDLKQRYAKSKAPATVEQYESEERRLERELAAVRTKKQAIIEAKQFKFMPSQVYEGGNAVAGVLIKKEGNSLAVSIADAETLVIQLDDYLKAVSEKEGSDEEEA